MIDRTLVNSSIQQSAVDESVIQSRIDELFLEHRRHIHGQTDRLFVVLMIGQWIGGIIMALAVSPKTWIAGTSYAHIHVWAAVVLGGAISSLPIVMGLCCPGTTATRHIMAIAQALWSALLIHLSGGRIETHFHVFGSLAFLAFYRDWRVLITATIVVAVDHVARGIWWPISVYGVAIESSFRWIEHAAWVAFEDVFLIISCLRGHREGRETCRRHAALELTNAEIENRVQLRTQELQHATARLESEFANHRKTHQDREKLYGELVNASRQAGMAEVATGVLHNVGNVLNSVNVTASLIIEQARKSRVGSLQKSADLIAEHQADLATFLTTDEQGKCFPRLLGAIARKLGDEQRSQIEELQSLIDHIDHIKEIIGRQQSLATASGMTEPLNLVELVEDALKISDSGLVRHGVEVVRRFSELDPVVTEKNKFLQIMVNLISNAKNALSECQRTDRTLTLVVAPDGEATRIEVRDNGIGIRPEHLAKLFSYGFTTRKVGHGFGLHSSALAAQELGGSLSVHSDGLDRGTTLTLRIPNKKESLCKV